MTGLPSEPTDMAATRRSRSASAEAESIETSDVPASAMPAAPALADEDRTLRIGQAAELLGISVDTIRRWEQDGRLATTRSVGGQRLVQIADVSRLLGERRRSTPD